MTLPHLTARLVLAFTALTFVALHLVWTLGA
mgnify:CR=1 FL=1